MSNPKPKTAAELLMLALDDEPTTDEDGREAVKRLGVDVGAWAASIRSSVSQADKEKRRDRFAAADAARRAELDRLSSKASMPSGALGELRETLKDLLARAPQGAAVHALKFEEATAEELAEMIRSVQHLLDEDDEG